MVKTPPTLDDLPQKEFDWEITRRLMAFIKPYTLRVVIAMGLMMVAASTTVAGPFIVKMALDSGIAARSIGTLQLAVGLYLLVAVIQWLAIFGRVNIMVRAGQAVIFDVRARLFEHLQELSLTFFSHYSVGRIITRVINDVNVLREFIVWTMLAMARDIFTLVGIVVAMLILDVKLSLLTFTVLPFMIGLMVMYRKQARGNYRKTRTAISWVNSVLAENINAVRVVQSFDRQEHNYTFFRENVNQNYLDASLKAAWQASMFFPAMDWLGTLAMAVVVWVGGTAVMGESITPGVLVAFVLYINRFFEPIRDLSLRFDSLQSTMASGERILDLLAVPVEVQDAPDAGVMPQIEGEVQFDHVSFHYPDDETTPVLEEINLHVAAGSTVALVGKTGAGKSTLVKLLARFHDPSQGRVLIDGQDIRQVTQASLRGQMGTVLQDPFLFAGTVEENIQFGRLDATHEEIEAAAKAVGAHHFILHLKNGYQTAVEEGGVILSVGQRQLISFARALLAQPRILILDEATSSIDTQTERIIQEALTRLLKGRTSFVIAHRLSTIVNADLIVVIEDGVVKEQGSHAELLAKGGIYYRLYSLRFEENEA